MLIFVFSLLAGNLIILILSLPLNCFNVYLIFYKKNRVYYSLGDKMDITKESSEHSFKYKLKCAGYLILTGGSFACLIISVILFIAEFILRDSNLAFGIFKTLKSSKL